MATTRPFAYNLTPEVQIPGTTIVGNICIGVSSLDYSSKPGGLTWWMGPDENSSYVICKDVNEENYPTPVGDVGGVQFWKCTNTDEPFRSLVQLISGENQASASAAATWLSSNGYWTNRPSGVAPVNSSPPVISGTTTLGGVLTTTNGTWTNSPSSFSYQWKRGATNVGTNTNTYPLNEDDSTAAITCVVTAINAAGSASATSNIITVPDYTPVNTVAPVVTFNNLRVGGQLITTQGTWNNPAGFDYQWYNVTTGNPIPGADYVVHILQTTDAGAEIRCRVRASNAAGSGIGFSNTVNALALSAPYFINQPVLSVASATVGQNIKIHYEDSDYYSNPYPPTFSYGWFKDGVRIPHAGSITYTPTVDDRGGEITAEIYATNSQGTILQSVFGACIVV